MSVATTPSTAPGQSLTERFAFAVELVLRGLSLSISKSRDVPPVAALACSTWNRLKRLVARFSTLVAAVEAGRFAAARRTPVAGRPCVLPATGTAAQTPAQIVKVPPPPKAFGWLLTLAPELNTRIGRAQIETVLADPAFLALLAEAPQAGRILRPLCHMLRIALPDCLLLPPRPRRPRATPSGDPQPALEARPHRPKPRWLRWPKSPPLPGMPRAP
ncbi:MAG: hypothetical protein JOZ42_11315, partial [Acetobacteraceae bacterium]|nr:hypothetical protein [Acetobacteraceae bacterium]